MVHIKGCFIHIFSAQAETTEQLGAAAARTPGASPSCGLHMILTGMVASR